MRTSKNHLSSILFLKCLKDETVSDLELMSTGGEKESGYYTKLYLSKQKITGCPLWNSPLFDRSHSKKSVELFYIIKSL